MSVVIKKWRVTAVIAKTKIKNQNQLQVTGVSKIATDAWVAKYTS